MKMLKVTTLLAAFVGLTLAAPAMAQREPTGISLEVGGNYILDSDVRDGAGDVGLRIGLGYQLPTPSLLGRETGGRSSVNLSYTTADDEIELTTWALTYEERVPFSMVARPGGASPYWGLGIGMFRSEAEFEFIEGGEVPVIVTVDESDTNFGGRVILGVDFASKWFVEASYNLSGDVIDLDTNSLALAAGVRF